MNCQYCKTPWEENKYHPDTCSNCGAEKPPPNTIQKYDPFLVKDMIVYSLYDPCREVYEWVFYRGTSLIGVVPLTRREIAEMDLKPWTDLTPIFLERLANL